MLVEAGCMRFWSESSASAACRACCGPGCGIDDCCLGSSCVTCVSASLLQAVLVSFPAAANAMPQGLGQPLQKPGDGGAAQFQLPTKVRLEPSALTGFKYMLDWHQGWPTGWMRQPRFTTLPCAFRQRPPLPCTMLPLPLLPCPFKRHRERLAPFRIPTQSRSRGTTSTSPPT